MRAPSKVESDPAKKRRAPGRSTPRAVGAGSGGEPRSVAAKRGVLARITLTHGIRYSGGHVHTSCPSGFPVVPSGYADGVDIGWSVRRHGVADEDIRHALRFPRATTDNPAGARRLVLGNDHAGRLLKVVVLDPDTDPVVIHAMPARASFIRLVEGRR